MIGKILERTEDNDEPVLPCVAEKDKEIEGIAVDRLQSLIERIERLENEKNGVSEDIRSIYAEAKSAGFDPKIMRAMVKLRKMNVADRDEIDFLTETYRKALDL